MHDTFLLNKISKSLKEICRLNMIKRLNYLSVIVNHNSHVNEENLLEHLQLHNKKIIGKDLVIEVQKQDIEDQTAIIQSIQGESN